jgi:hypothetical protein
VFPRNHLKFLDVTRKLYVEKLTVLCGVAINDYNYYLDIVVCGKLEDMLLFFNGYKEPDDYRVEMFWLDQYANKRLTTKEEIKEWLTFAKQTCIEHDIEIIWYRPSDIPFPRTIPYTKVLAEYCNAFFVYE